LKDCGEIEDSKMQEISKYLDKLSFKLSDNKLLKYKYNVRFILKCLCNGIIILDLGELGEVKKKIEYYLINPDGILDLTKSSRSKVQILKTLENDSNSMIQSNLIKCGKCKNSNISINQRQTRSGDEGMTVYYICTDCNNSWKS
jgi:DNA-directed RNA polymerase subunit M/transcription elongation factor TFIIS